MTTKILVVNHGPNTVTLVPLSKTDKGEWVPSPAEVVQVPPQGTAHVIVHNARKWVIEEVPSGEG